MTRVCRETLRPMSVSVVAGCPTLTAARLDDEHRFVAQLVGLVLDQTTVYRDPDPRAAAEDMIVSLCWEMRHPDGDLDRFRFPWIHVPEVGSVELTPDPYE